MRKKTRRGDQMKPACLAATLIEGDVRNAAIDAGLTLRVSVVQKRKQRSTLHWMFNDEATGRRVLNYWPGNGTVRAPGGGKGKADDPWQAFEEAKRQACRMPA